MTRTHRRQHLRAWALIAPIILIILIAAIRTRNIAATALALPTTTDSRP